MLPLGDVVVGILVVVVVVVGVVVVVVAGVVVVVVVDVVVGIVYGGRQAFWVTFRATAGNIVKSDTK